MPYSVKKASANKQQPGHLEISLGPDTAQTTEATMYTTFNFQKTDRLIYR